MRIRRLWIATLVTILTVFVAAMATLHYRQSALSESSQVPTGTGAILEKQQPPAAQSGLRETDGLEFERKVIKGVPFSATLMVETVETLPDGSSKSSKSVSLIYRDAEGRTRRDRMPVDSNEAVVSKQTPRVTTINDPLAGFSYLLEHRTNIARRTVFSSQPQQDSGGPGTVIPSSASSPMSSGSSEILPVPPTGDTKQKLQSGGSSSTDAKRESLGLREIEGFTAEGTRITISIPASKIGNERPLETVVERWYSPELKTVLLIERSDPRLGKSVYRLTGIQRSDPAATLFTVPSEFKIIPN